MDSSAPKPAISQSDIVMCAALEAGGARLGRRLISGRTCPHCGSQLSTRRPLRRLLGAIVVEVILDGLVAEAFALRRKRARAAARADVEAERPTSPAQRYASVRQQQYVSVPQQRTATQPANSHVEVRSVS
jgi:hypothetical protein